MAENSATGEISKETVAREERIRLVKTRQNEERQRKFEELRAQALAEQKLREQKEEERRKRIEELRMRDNDRRQQVEERKRQIEDAERDRREAILRKNQERDARLENKRRSDRPASVFAFGSSTPRMLEPADTGGSFWAYRRAASTMNVALGGCNGPPPGRRSSERDTDGSKKRATSAGGLDRDTNEDMRTSSSMYEVFHWFSPNPINNPAYKKTDENEQGSGTQSPAVFTNRVARRRTDLMPTIPSPRDAHSMSARPFTRSPGVRSGEVTPSRPGSALSGSSSITSSVSLRHSGNRPLTAPRRPRPASIADTGLSSDFARNKQNTSSVDIKTGETLKPPLPKPRTKSAKTTPNKTSLPPKNIKRNATSTKTTPIQSPSVEVAPAIGQLAVVNGVRNIGENAANNVQDNNSVEILKNDRKIAVTESDVKSDEKNDIINEISAVNDLVTLETTSETPKINDEDKKSAETIETSNFETVMNLIDTELPTAIQNTQNHQVLLTVANNDLMTQSLKEEPVSKIDMSDEMSASMFAKTRITTEEEAKAALAERRRLAREEAERQAELERQRQEAEARAEQERLRQEEEEQRRLEEETLRLAEEQRKLEEQRLLQAIEETKKREEEEKQRLAEEARQRAEKEEQERKAREEAEKQRIEMAERLKQEEKEREARRKRVEAIMLRTRGKTAPNSNSQTKSDGENEEKDKTNIESTVSNPELLKENVVQNGTDSNKQKIEGDANKQTVESNTTIPVINTSVDNASIPLVEQSKQHNGDFPTNVDNIRLEQQNITNSTLIDISEFDPFKNANAPSDNVDKLSDVNSNQ